MRRLRVSHRTEIRYPAQVVESVNHVRLIPRSGNLQVVHDARVRTFPEAPVSIYDDVYGNRVGWFHVHEPHSRLVIEAFATVEPLQPRRPLPDVLRITGWSDTRTGEYRDAQVEFLRPSRLVPRSAAVDAYAAELGVDAPTPGEWLVELELAVAETIFYAPGFTRVDTPIARVIDIRRGVCQDLAQVFIALARRRGIATRYVSGWLYQPGAGGPGESHAWVEAFLPGAGWVQFDPTHPDPELTRYARIGVGRDYSDVPPVLGTYLGPAASDMSVEVIVERDD